MHYEIEDHAGVQLEVYRLKRALREAEDRLKEYEKHPASQSITSPPKAVVIDGVVVVLDRTAGGWDYTTAEVVE